MKLTKLNMLKNNGLEGQVKVFCDIKMGVLQKTGLWQKMKFTEQSWLEVVVWHRIISPNQDEVGGNWVIMK